MTREEIKSLQRTLNSLGADLKVDGYRGPKTIAAEKKYLNKDVIEPIPVPTPKGYFGAPWVGVDLDLLGRSETDTELNKRYVPTWKAVGLPGYKTLVGKRHAWCAIRMIKAWRQVGVNVKGLNAGAYSLSKWGKRSPFWFGAGLDIKHKKGGRHVAIFLYWIDEKSKIAATLDGNRSNKFAVFATDLSGRNDSLVSGPRWPTDWPDGQFVSRADVLKAYPHLRVGGSGSGTR